MSKRTSSSAFGVGTKHKLTEQWSVTVIHFAFFRKIDFRFTISISDLTIFFHFESNYTMQPSVQNNEQNSSKARSPFSESISLSVTQKTESQSVEIQFSPRENLDLETLKEEIKKIADKQKRKEAYAKYMKLLPPDSSTGADKKQQTKAERREHQERQRALKQSKQDEKTAPKKHETQSAPKPKPPPAPARTQPAAASTAKSTVGVHRAIYQCGLWMKAYKIIGSNARVRGTMLALKSWLQQLAATADEAKAYSHENFAGTNKLLSVQLSYLEGCRKKSIGMGNAIRLLKEASFRQSLGHADEKAAYFQLVSFCDLFLTEKIDFAMEKIVSYGLHQVRRDDVIATFGHSECVARTLLLAASRVPFTVVIIDSPPLFEGRILFRDLQYVPGLQIRYCLLPSLTCALNDATKLFIGASAVLSNGDVLSRAGTAMAATIACHYHLPVVAFSETYKFTNRVWIGSLTNNETHDGSGGAYLYDLTPMQKLDVIVTEYGPLPPCSVSTLIRDKTDVSS